MILLALACAGDPAVAIDPIDTDVQADPRPPVALCDGWNTRQLNPEEIDAKGPEVMAVADLGIRLIRPHRPRGHVFAYNIVHPPDVEEALWGMPDQVVEAAGAAHVSVFATIYPISDPGHSTSGVIGIGVPEDYESYYQFVVEMVERYDGDGKDDMPGLTAPIRHWEIGNEPMCSVDDTTCQAGFVDLVRQTAEAIRAADADAFVIAGAAPPLFVREAGDWNDTSAQVYRTFTDFGGFDVVDRLNVHLETGRTAVSLTDQVAAWREIVGRDDIPVWITEMGTRSVRDRVVVADTPAGEAAWLLDSLAQAEDANVEQVFWCLAGGDILRFPEVTGAIRDYNASR